MITRRTLLQGIGAASLLHPAGARSQPTNPLRVRTITAGVELRDVADLAPVEKAVVALQRCRRTFEDAGYEVQTLRVSTNPLVGDLDARAREHSLVALQALDRAAKQNGIVVAIGPALLQDAADAAFPEWAAQFVSSTEVSCCSAVIASSRGAHLRAAATIARAMTAIAATLEGGIGNFRFAAAGNVPAGTPFFPVSWHRGEASLAIGLESASVVEQALMLGAGDALAATALLRRRMNEALAPIQKLAMTVADRERRVYLGIDTSPAPGKDRSIAAAIEVYTRKPFGSSGTLEACAAITSALKSLDVKACGYSGLMLPVLENPLLAQRAGEGRYGIRELLLYSSVCGTGLDVVPIPGATSQATIAALLGDVAALSMKLSKPLSTRLFIVPDKRVGDMVRFNDPVLTDSVVMALE